MSPRSETHAGTRRDVSPRDHLVAVLRLETGQDALIRLRKVELPVVERRRWDIGSASVCCPTDLIGDVAGPGNGNGEQRVALVAGHAINGVSFYNGAGGAVVS